MPLRRAEAKAARRADANAAADHAAELAIRGDRAAELAVPAARRRAVDDAAAERKKKKNKKKKVQKMYFDVDVITSKRLGRGRCCELDVDRFHVRCRSVATVGRLAQKLWKRLQVSQGLPQMWLVDRAGVLQTSWSYIAAGLIVCRTLPVCDRVPGRVCFWRARQRLWTYVWEILREDLQPARAVDAPCLKQARSKAEALAHGPLDNKLKLQLGLHKYGLPYTLGLTNLNFKIGSRNRNYVIASVRESDVDYGDQPGNKPECDQFESDGDQRVEPGGDQQRDEPDGNRQREQPDGDQRDEPGGDRQRDELDSDLQRELDAMLEEDSDEPQVPQRAMPGPAPRHVPPPALQHAPPQGPQPAAPRSPSPEEQIYWVWWRGGWHFYYR